VGTIRFAGGHEKPCRSWYGGIDYERARTVLKVPDDFRVEATATIGKPVKREYIPIGLQEREIPNDRTLAEIVDGAPYKALHHDDY
jgi:hypothetical protein